MICRIADFLIDFENVTPGMSRILNEYCVNSQNHDFKITLTISDVAKERVLSGSFANDGYMKYVSANRKLSDWLPSHNAFVLHSACFDVDGVGVAFAAHSGTGKTTHMNLWQKLLGDKMVVVNGDKPIVRFFDDEPETPYAYGTPWNGKEWFGCNMRTKLKHICFIERSETNFVEKMDKNEVINLIFNQVYKPKDPVAVMKTMELIDRLLSCCNLWKIHCNMEDEAAEVAYNTIFGE